MSTEQPQYSRTEISDETKRKKPPKKSRLQIAE